MKRLVFALALFALLAVPAPAAAKGRTTATVCGPGGCENLGDAGGLMGVDGGGPVDDVVHPVGQDIRITRRGEGVYWMRVDDARLAELAKRVDPFPAPEITAVTVGSRRVTDNPASYLELFSVKSTDENAYPQGVADWEQVTFVSKQKSPWTLAQSSIHFSPANGMLQRGIEMLKLPDEMSSDLRRGEALTGGSSAFPWRNELLALLAALALLFAASFIRPLRRRIVVRRAPTTA